MLIDKQSRAAASPQGGQRCGEACPPTLTGGESPKNLTKGYFVAVPSQRQLIDWVVFDGEHFTSHFSQRQIYSTPSAAHTIARWVGGSVVSETSHENQN